MPAIRKITATQYATEKKSRGRPKGSKNKPKMQEIMTEDTPATALYTWKCKQGHTQKVSVRMYDMLCHCNEVMECNDPRGILK